VVSDFCEAKIVSNHANLMAHPSIHFAHKIRKTLRASGCSECFGRDTIMKQNRWYCIVTMLALFHVSLAYAFGPKTVFVPRSQSVNAARDLVGLQRDIDLFDGGDWYWTTAITGEYNRTFQPSKIANSLFGGQCLQFSGSRVVDRGAHDILADYFGLPADFQSTVSFCPRITNGIIDFSSYIGLDTIWDGLYIRWHTPLVHTTWSLNMHECIQAEGTAFHPAGYMGPVRIERDQLAASVSQAWCEPIAYGDVQEGIKYGKVCPCALTRTHFSDTELAVGWNFAQDKWYHFGLNIGVTLPWSERHDPEFLFAPQIGNEHHVALGLGFTSHVDIWEGDHEQTLALFLDGNFSHLFSDKQMRSYDFKNNGGGSRYILLEEFAGQSSTVPIFTAPFLPEPNQYAQRLVPAINATTLCSQISIDLIIDIAFKISYFRGGWGFDAGYSFWSRSPEKLECRAPFPDGKYALKGDAQIYGFNPTTLAEIPLSATQSQSTLHGAATGASNFVAGFEFTNADCDTPLLAYSDTAIVQPLYNLNNVDSLDLVPIAQSQIATSHTALLLSDNDINDSSGLSPHLYSHKFFTHIDYRWAYTKYTPFIGIGGEVEWATACKIACTGFSKGGVWIKGGVDW
jgi:hypothetical protein